MLSDNGVEPEEERSQFKSNWTVEWKDDAGQIAKTQEESDYSQALRLFNELSGVGKDVVLYEIRMLLADPSAQPKKIPILNSEKAKKIKALEVKRPHKSGVSERTARRTPTSTKPGLKDLRTRIFILIAVIAVFVITLFLISILFTGNDFVHNFLTYAYTGNFLTLGAAWSNL